MKRHNIHRINVFSQNKNADKKRLFSYILGANLKYLTLIFVLLIAGCNNTHSAHHPTHIYNNKETDSPAVLVVKIDPKYPEHALQQGIEGYLKFNAVVNEIGALENIEVVESSPKGVFEHEGLRALNYWRFKPALVNGKLVKATHSGTLFWQLENVQ